jgi:hypothetical protein
VGDSGSDKGQMASYVFSDVVTRELFMIEIFDTVHWHKLTPTFWSVVLLHIQVE